MIFAIVQDAVQGNLLSPGLVPFAQLPSPGDFVQLSGTTYAVQHVLHGWGDNGMPAVWVSVK